MLFEKILVPLDGSQLAEAVLPYATDIAEHHKATVILMQVVPLPSQVMSYVAAVDVSPVAPPDFTALEASLQEEVRRAEEYLAGKAEELKQRGINARSLVQRGRPGPAIVQCAREQKIGLIAISTHGRSGLGRLVLGSVADYVLRAAGLPVLVIKPDIKGEGES